MTTAGRIKLWIVLIIPGIVTFGLICWLFANDGGVQ